MKLYLGKPSKSWSSWPRISPRPPNFKCFKKLPSLGHNFFSLSWRARDKERVNTLSLFGTWDRIKLFWFCVVHRLMTCNNKISSLYSRLWCLMMPAVLQWELRGPLHTGTEGQYHGLLWCCFVYKRNFIFVLSTCGVHCTCYYASTQALPLTHWSVGRAPAHSGLSGHPSEISDLFYISSHNFKLTGSWILDSKKGQNIIE